MAATLALGCKPATEAEKFRRALSWTRVEDVKAQLDSGKDAKAAFEDGHAPIHVVAASVHGSPEVMRLLIERGVDVNAKTPQGKTAWDLIWGEERDALDDDDAGMLIALLDGGAEPSPASSPTGETRLHIAARKTDSARLMSLLVAAHGGDVASADDNGWTPLHVAVHHNHAASVTGLLESKANPNAETTKVGGVTWHYEAGSRPLDVLPQESRIVSVDEVRKLLIDHGAKPSPALANKAK